jgi:hypothetical protein
MATEPNFYDFGEKETEENAVYYWDENLEDDILYEEDRQAQSRTSSFAISSGGTVKRTSSMMGFLFGTVRKGSQSTKPEERVPNLEVKLLSAKGLPGISLTKDCTYKKDLTEPWVTITVVRNKGIPLDVKYKTNKSGIGLNVLVRIHNGIL